MMATEAYISCDIDQDHTSSQPGLSYNKEKLIQWIQVNIPSLQSLERYKQRTKKKRQIEQYNQLVKQKSKQNAWMHDSIKR